MFKLNGQNVTRGVHYEFASQTGVLTLIKAGVWQIHFQDTSIFNDPTANPVDIPGVHSRSDGVPSSAPLSVFLHGKDLLGIVQPDSLLSHPTNLTLRLILEGGGSIAASGQVLAVRMTMTDSLVPGHANGSIRVKAIFDTGNPYGLEISGDLNAPLRATQIVGGGSVRVHGNMTANAKIDIDEDLGGAITIDGNVLNAIGTANYIRIKRMVGG